MVTQQEKAKKQGVNELYDCARQAPQWALRRIGAGRLKGKTDINPQWRIEFLTNFFGPVGFGWRWEEIERWTADYAQEVACFVKIALYVNDPESGEWSFPIYGVGGNKLVANEKNGLHLNDEAWKAAVTDALSTAMKMLGVAADVYAGLWDGSKYRDVGGNGNGQAEQPAEQAEQPAEQPAQESKPEPKPRRWDDKTIRDCLATIDKLVSNNSCKSAEDAYAVLNNVIQPPIPKEVHAAIAEYFEAQQ